MIGLLEHGAASWLLKKVEGTRFVRFYYNLISQKVRFMISPYEVHQIQSLKWDDPNSCLLATNIELIYILKSQNLHVSKILKALLRPSIYQYVLQLLSPHFMSLDIVTILLDDVLY